MNPKESFVFQSWPFQKVWILDFETLKIHIDKYLCLNIAFTLRVESLISILWSQQNMTGNLVYYFSSHCIIIVSTDVNYMYIITTINS